MKLFTTGKACKMTCAHLPEQFLYCDPSKCMAWVRVHIGCRRENHSGAHEYLLATMAGQNYMRDIHQTGPDNSGGYLHIEEVGYCGRNTYLPELLKL